MLKSFRKFEDSRRVALGAALEDVLSRSKSRGVTDDERFVMAKMVGEYGAAEAKESLLLLPARPIQGIEFTVEGSAALANCIRRTLVSGVPVSRLQFDTTHLNTTDPYIRPDMLRRNITMLPLDQKRVQTGGAPLISLMVQNKTTRVRNVLASEMRVVMDGKEIETHELIASPGAVITVLRPDTQLNISEMAIVTGRSIDEEGTFGALADITYDEVTPEKRYKISFRTNRNVPPAVFLRTALEQLLARVRRVHEGVEGTGKDISEEEALIEGSVVTRLQRGEETHFVIDGEYRRIPMLVVRYMFEKDPKKFVCAAIKHIQYRIGIIRVRADDAKERVLAATHALQKDLRAMLEAVKQQC